MVNDERRTTRNSASGHLRDIFHAYHLHPFNQARLASPGDGYAHTYSVNLEDEVDANLQVLRLGSIFIIEPYRSYGGIEVRKKKPP